MQEQGQGSSSRPISVSSETLARRGEFSATESEDMCSSTATTPKRAYPAGRKLSFHKDKDGNKEAYPADGPRSGFFLASWEEHEHKKRKPNPDANDDDDATAVRCERVGR